LDSKSLNQQKLQ